jgi:hypothetical protein
MKKPSLDKPAVNLMLDSGAYSAWRSDNPIDLEQYAEYLEKAGSAVQCYVNLDVIPGERGNKHPSSIEVEESAKRGWQNYLRLKKMGLHPIPVFHRGEQYYWLEKMLGEGVEYLGLGGIAFGSYKMRKQWLDQVFSFLCGDRGYPPVKLHGFGVASVPFLLAYPWYSIDTTSWRTPTLYGKVFVPFPNADGSYCYDKTPKLLIISRRSRKKEDNMNIHLEKMGKKTTAYAKQYFTSLGFDFDACRDVDLERRRMLLCYYQEVRRQHRPKPFRLKKKLRGFYDSLSSLTTIFEPKRVRIYYGIGDIKEDWQMFRDEGIKDRLISYLECRKLPLDSLRDFVRTGIVEQKEKK